MQKVYTKLFRIINLKGKIHVNYGWTIIIWYLFSLMFSKRSKTSKDVEKRETKCAARKDGCSCYGRGQESSWSNNPTLETQPVKWKQNTEGTAYVCWCLAQHYALQLRYANKWNVHQWRDGLGRGRGVFSAESLKHEFLHVCRSSQKILSFVTNTTGPRGHYCKSSKTENDSRQYCMLSLNCGTRKKLSADKEICFFLWEEWGVERMIKKGNISSSKMIMLRTNM